MPYFPTTVEISSDTNGLISARLLRGLLSHPADEMYGFAQLNLNAFNLPPLRSRSSVQLYGETLLSALELHSSIKSELSQISNTPAGIYRTLGFSITTSVGGQYRWEALCFHSKQFLAENGTCGLKRIAVGETTQGSELRSYSARIKMAAYLSPSQVKSKDELTAIITALKNAQNSGLQIDAVIYLGEQTLLDSTQCLVDQGALQGITVRPMPASALAIEEALRNDRAQVLHFFCHGHSQDGVQLLEFASINDVDVEAEKGSVTISIERLQECLVVTGNTWLTVLNSCSGATDVPNLFSMAATLAKSASPITIGMAEPIKDIDATLFAQSFYPRAFATIYDAINNLDINCTTTVDLGTAVSHARKVLFDAAVLLELNDPDSFSRWCLPIYYVRDPALIVMHAADASMKERIETVASALQNLPPSTPSALRDQILNVLANPPGIDKKLWPDRNGNLT